MASENPTNLKIRLFNGPYKGQEIILPEGPVTLGNSSECDFVILEAYDEEKQPEKETGIGELKFELVVSEGAASLQIKPEEALPEILIDGEPVEPQEDRVLLPKKQYIEIGTIAFVLGEENQDLSNIKKQQKITTEKAQKTGRFSLTNILNLNKKTVLIASALVVMFALATITFFFFRAGTPAPETEKKETTTDIRHLVAMFVTKENLKDIIIKWKQDNSLQLSGYVASQEVKGRFLDKLNDLGISYEENIIDMESVVSLSTLLLQGKGYSGVEVSPGKRAGFIIIKGKILGDVQWDAVSKQLIKDVNGLKGWRIISTQTRFSEVLLILLSDRKLIQLLSVVDRDNVTFITGSLDNEQANILNTLIEEAKERTKTSKEVIYQNIPYTGNLYPEYLPSPLASFGGDSESAYLILENGLRCNIGLRLPSGYIITSIGKDGITLEKGGDIAHFPIFT